MIFGMSPEEFSLLAVFGVLILALLFFLYGYLPRLRRRRQRAEAEAVGRAEAEARREAQAAEAAASDAERDAQMALGKGLVETDYWWEIATPEERRIINDAWRFRWDRPEERWDRPEDFEAEPRHWPLALALPFAFWHQAIWDRLPGVDGNWTRRMLIRDWGIRTRHALLEQLHWLHVAGHRVPFNLERENAAALDEGEAFAVEAMLEARAGDEEAAERLWRFRRARADDRGIMRVDFTAWDLVRFAMLVRAGTAAGYLTVEEGMDFLLEQVDEMRACYGSWPEVGEHFRVARWYWHSVGGEQERETDVLDMARQQALVLAMSPWHDVPWDMPVPPAQGRFRDALEAEELLEPGAPLLRRAESFWGRRRAEPAGG